jgi:sec-independent protein translocase protein TatA
MAASSQRVAQGEAIMALGLPELLVILVIVMLLFGAGRVSKLGKELGSAIGALKKGINEGDEQVDGAKDGQPEKA